VRGGHGSLCLRNCLERRPDLEREAELSRRMAEVASRKPGFISYKSYVASDGDAIRVIRFDSREALKAGGTIRPTGKRGRKPHASTTSFGPKTARSSTTTSGSMEFCVPVVRGRGDAEALLPEGMGELGRLGQSGVDLPCHDQDTTRRSARPSRTAWLRCRIGSAKARSPCPRRNDRCHFVAPSRGLRFLRENESPALAGPSADGRCWAQSLLLISGFSLPVGERVGERRERV
jgi:hypothetical protein